MATLLDRFMTPEGAVIRAQNSRTGECFDIAILPADVELAASLWGGSDVPYKIVDGRPVYDRGDQMTDAEFEAFDNRIRNAAARKIAPLATDDELSDIYDAPMSQNQRRRALVALAQQRAA